MRHSLFIFLLAAVSGTALAGGDNATPRDIYKLVQSTGASDKRSYTSANDAKGENGRPAAGNTVQGNRIGTDMAGTAATGPVTVPVHTQNGKRFNLVIHPDGSVEPLRVKLEDILISSAHGNGEAAKGSSSGGGAWKTNDGGASATGLNKAGTGTLALNNSTPNLTVSTDSGLSFDLIAKPDGNSTALLLPAVQKVREAAR